MAGRRGVLWDIVGPRVGRKWKDTQFGVRLTIDIIRVEDKVLCRWVPLNGSFNGASFGIFYFFKFAK
jgi:hypothetical protein